MLLSEATKSLLETAFSSPLSNLDHKKGVEKFGVPDHEWVCCPKLNPVLKTTFPKEAIKADGYLYLLHQFWLDAVAPLTAMIESVDDGELTVAEAVTTVQLALVLMGNAQQKRAQEQ